MDLHDALSAPNRSGWEGIELQVPAGLNLEALGICRDAIFGGKKEQFFYFT
jgi:hypothetical protein